jgi:AAA domain, putative AbiEii toxin, Type IV TA system
VSLARVPFSFAELKCHSKSKNAVISRTLDRHGRKEGIIPLSPAQYQSVRQYYINEPTHITPSITYSWSPNLTTTLATSFAEEQWVSKPAFPDLFGMSHRYLSTNRIMTDAIPRASTEGGLSETEIDNIFAGQIETVWRAYTNEELSSVTAIQSEGLRELLRSLLFSKPEPSERPPPEVRRAYDRATHFLGTKPARENSAQYREFHRRFNDEPHFRGVVKDIDQIERRIEQAEEPRRKLAQLIDSFFSAGKTMRFTNTGIEAQVEGETIPLASLSSGEKQLVRILIEVIMSEDDVIIIDEPELSMHIDWQRDLVSAMRTVNPSVQIVMATHSPDIMQNVADECIFRL